MELQAKDTLKRLEHVYGVPWKQGQGAVSLRQKRLFLLGLSEGEEELRDQLLEQHSVPCLSYVACCCCPFVGGAALYCAYQVTVLIKNSQQVLSHSILSILYLFWR